MIITYIHFLLKARDVYFMESGDKIRYFFEEGAINENGQLVVDKQRCLNKIGHVKSHYFYYFNRSII